MTAGNKSILIWLHSCLFHLVPIITPGLKLNLGQTWPCLGLSVRLGKHLILASLSLFTPAS